MINKNNNINVKEITPSEYRCIAAACPGIFSIIDENKYAIIGKKVNANDLGIANRVGKDEEIVVVDSDMIRKIFLND